MRTVESLKLVPVWVNPDHLVSTAKILMQGYQMRVIGVAESGRLLGLVTRDRLEAEPDFSLVGASAQPFEVSFQVDTPIRTVADAFVESALDYAPVFAGPRFVGIVTANMLLKELGRSWDPLTGLSWSDVLREWGMDHLKRGREVTILFVDLDNFGDYNKRFGHVIGDKILRQAAELLTDAIDPEQDVLVRYGGDEFAIGTLRSREEAEGFLEQISLRAGTIAVPEVNEPVTLSTGIWGGKRTRERENTHYAATLDNLINLASRDCLAHKRSKTGGSPPPEPTLPTSGPDPIEAATTIPTLSSPPHFGTPEILSPEPTGFPLPHDPLPETPEIAPPEPPTLAIVEESASADLTPPPSQEPAATTPGIRVISVHAEDSVNSLTQVVLSIADGIVVGVNAPMGRPLPESIAVATLKALERAFPKNGIHINSVRVVELDGNRYVSVNAETTVSGRPILIEGVEDGASDLKAAVARATVQAFLNANAVYPNR